MGKRITVSPRLIAYREFMSKELRILKAANPGTKQRDIFRMASQIYRIKRDSGQL
jgi:hypothetical protein